MKNKDLSNYLLSFVSGNDEQERLMRTENDPCKLSKRVNSKPFEEDLSMNSVVSSSDDYTVSDEGILSEEDDDEPNSNNKKKKRRRKHFVSRVDIKQTMKRLEEKDLSSKKVKLERQNAQKILSQKAYR